MDNAAKNKYVKQTHFRLNQDRVTRIHHKKSFWIVVIEINIV